MDGEHVVKTYSDFIKAGGTKALGSDRRHLVLLLPEPFEWGEGPEPDEISKRESRAHIAGLKEALNLVNGARPTLETEAVAGSIRARIKQLEDQNG